MRSAIGTEIEAIMCVPKEQGIRMEEGTRSRLLSLSGHGDGRGWLPSCARDTVELAAATSSILYIILARQQKSLELVVA